MNTEIENKLIQLKEKLSKKEDLREKKSELLAFSSVQEALEKPFYAESYHQLRKEGSPWEEIAFFAILAIGQEKIVFREQSEIKKILSTLATIERFYASLGGLVGYFVTALEMMKEGTAKTKRKYFRPPFFDLTKGQIEIKKAIGVGIALLPQMAEIYPVGGLGDRLNLKSEEGASLPSASLPFCGRTLLEGLVRDLSAREYLYYKLFSAQVFVPIALMTSYEKDNDSHIRQICEKNHWFGRGDEHFFIFSQLSVPVITQEGNFSMKSGSELNLHPGGHGAIWRVAEEKGVYKWLQGQKKDLLLIRQINNPIAGLDFGLLALMGRGKLENKTFGFASCKRLPKTAEGVLVLVEKEDKTYSIINIEYTDFAKYGIEDIGDEEGYSLYPSNTNILFANLPKLLPHIKENPLPGLVLNMKSEVPTYTADGTKKMVKGGRLESMMQSIAESLNSTEKDRLPTFVTYNERKKTISVTKKSFEEGKPLVETPQGAFYDLMSCGWELLKECGAEVPPFSTPSEYLQRGPNLLFLYHPALGPLYEVIKQKIRGGNFKPFSEMQLEIAECYLENLQLEGSLIIHASQVVGEVKNNRLCYSQKTGKCTLINVRVGNRGIDRKPGTLFWKNHHSHFEKLEIKLEGLGEFHAENVTFEGNLAITVPDGERWTAYMEGEKLNFAKEKISQPSWHWQYRLIKDEIKLFRQVAAPHSTFS